MKTLFTKAIYLVLLSTLCNTISAQTFKLLSNDSAGDHNIGPDLKAISYKVNIAQDSIWFKIETNNSITTNDGFMIGLDTNQNTSDGETWKIGTTNTVRKYDHALFIAYDINTASFIEVRLGKVNSNPTITAGVSLVDTSTLIVSTKLSLLDNDKKFDLVLGAAAADVIFTGATIDQSPEAGYLTIDANTTSVKEEPEAANFKIYPNPTTNSIYWKVEPNTSSSKLLKVFDMAGRKVKETSYASGELDVSELKIGVYYIKGNNSTMLPFIKQ